MKDTHKNPTISFRPTEWERKEIEMRIALCGIRKKDYIVKSCMNSNIVVVGTKENIQRIVDAVKNMEQTMKDITEQLREEAAPSLSAAGIEEMKAEFLSLTKTVVQILNGASHLLKNQSDK